MAKALHDARGKVPLGAVLAAASFLIYAGTIFALPQVQNARYCCEQSSFAAAVSNVIYRTRIGGFYADNLDFFLDRFTEPLNQVLPDARTPGVGLPAIPASVWVPTTRDGNGIGYPLVATAAFRLFGLHAWALPATMLLLMAVSAIVYLWRFSGAYAAVVVLYFGALTSMLFTTLVWDPSYAVQIPVAGIRYFSLLSVLPVFHILLTLLDVQPERAGALWHNAALLAVQTLVLVLSILVRGSAISMVGAVLFVALLLAWRHRRDRGRIRAVIVHLLVMGMASLVLMAAIIATIPRQYLAQGRVGTVVWQRVTESIGANPAWPFPGANDLFDCKEHVPQGLESGMSDSNGGCIWFDYVKRHGIPADTLYDKTFGSLYETALREAFFKIAWRYPTEVLAAFVYYKPQRIVSSIVESLALNLAGDQAKALLPEGLRVEPYPPLAIGLWTAAIAVALAFFAFARIAPPELRMVARLALLSALFTIPPYLAAWARPHTSADLLLYCLFGAGLALGAVLVGLQRTPVLSAGSRLR